MFTSFLKGFTRDDLAYAIKRDVSLQVLINQLQPQVILGMIKFVKTTGYFSREIRQDFNYDNIINYLNQTRPDIVDEIKSSKVGIQWFRKNVENIKNMLLNGNGG